MRAAALLFAIAFAPTLPGAPQDTCRECHGVLDGPLQRPAALIRNDVHVAAGLSCADCHGGDRTSEDPSQAMSRSRGFIGKVARTAVPKLCARCHTDPNYMRKYRPQQRVDQYEMYQTSVHGKRLARGDTNAATCIDCHSVHDIRPVKDVLSPVHPLRLPETCGRCHTDSQKMARYGIGTNQLQEYRSSVHWEALNKRGDLSAPNCASCHGNHGAKPPQVESVAAVCGTCHVLYARLYDRSVHKPVFSSESGGGGCIVCHGKHAIHKPTTALLAGPGAVCSQCHDSDSQGGVTAARMSEWITGLDAALERSAATLASAERYGMEVSEAQVRLLDGRENLVKARLALHSFQPDEVRKPVEAGMVIAAETLQSGQAALREKDVRRLGLAVSVVFIAITMAALWILVRKIERASNGRLPEAS